METEHGFKTVREFYESDAQRWRCQTWWRESDSWAGFLGRHKDGSPFYFDEGDRLKLTLSRDDSTLLIHEMIDRRDSVFTLAELGELVDGWSAGRQGSGAIDACLKRIVSKKLSPHGMKFSEIKSALKDRITPNQSNGGSDSSRLLTAFNKFNEEYALLRTKRACVVVVPGVEGYRYYNLEGMQKFESNKTIFINRKSIPIFPEWVKWVDRRGYMDVEFAPEKHPELWPVGDMLNLWQGMESEPVEGNCTMLINHIKEVWCHNDEKLFKYVVQWLALGVQRPWEKPGTALVVIGAPGAGKSVIGEVMVDMFGAAHGTTLVRNNQHGDRFNAILANKIFTLCEEAAFADPKVAGNLKNLITGPWLPIEEKFMNLGNVRNCMRMMFISNGGQVTTLELDDRRFVYLDASDKYVGNKDYFKELHEEIGNGGGPALHYHMLNEIDLEGCDLRAIPESNSRHRWSDQMSAASTPVRFWYERLSHIDLSLLPEEQPNPKTKKFKGRELPGEAPIRKESDWETGPVIVSKNSLYDQYKNWCNEHRIGQYQLKSKDAFFQVFYKDMVGGQFEQTRPTNNGKRFRSLKIPDVFTCRRLFHKHVMGGRGSPKWEEQ